MIAYWLIVCHLIGDYVFQSDWMAQTKTKKSTAALVHVVTYTLPFVALTRAPWVLIAIAGSHFIIDRWRLARYVCWAKNFIAPHWLDTGRVTWAPSQGEPCGYIPPKIPVMERNRPWKNCSATGYPSDSPLWLTVWLMIIVDQAMHLLCNGLAWEVLQ